MYNLSHCECFNVSNFGDKNTILKCDFFGVSFRVIVRVQLTSKQTQIIKVRFT